MSQHRNYFMKKNIIGLIPTRLSSKRLYQKPLLEINKIPLIIHTYKRAKLSKKLDNVVICCDDRKIYDVVIKYTKDVIITSKNNKNGTERIAEAYNKIKKRYDLVVDIQGDEPLINPSHIDAVIDYHLKNINVDIILPVLKIKDGSNKNIVKVVVDKLWNVKYLSRSEIPHFFNKNKEFFYKHLSIISFKPKALNKFYLSSQQRLERIENVELLRALEIGLNIKSFLVKGSSFSVDTIDDYLKAKRFMKKDKIFQLYVNKKNES